jgi:hypothetical protein
MKKGKQFYFVGYVGKGGTFTPVNEPHNGRIVMRKTARAAQRYVDEMVSQARFLSDLAVARCTVEEVYPRKALIKAWRAGQQE